MTRLEHANAPLASNVVPGLPANRDMSAPVVMETHGIGKRFGDFTAVQGVDLQIRRHQVHSVIGPNGAGKSTLFNLLAGTLKSSFGSILFEGRDVTRLSDYHRVQAGIARSFQITSLFNALSVFENLRLAAQGAMPRHAFRFWTSVADFEEPKEQALALIRRLGLDRFADVPAGTLAHGQQRLLEVGMGVAARPRLLLLDEPTSGMGVNDLPLIQELIADLSRDHTVVLIEHNMSIVLSISHRITVMAQGAVLAEGVPEAIRGHEGVRRAYLGDGTTI